ncbi:high frequency lysogenization protein HflD [Marinibactrum halimedae]|uniref:High frequency lysogenization protein HflD homolog n=1 Tax=Marinibactrum halimedae TaxID=1444977 RepID=A0AA37T671_9GAMM|nr:high frequency lysogenization protein HflD [Marinibactrum halimedae]MCD9460407.1 high frequency lysogenization protein HflD [Marinibactrum halimedae]GLS27464.1 high frequency lysogenization protein HflD [Marinibactrum halimedae]
MNKWQQQAIALGGMFQAAALVEQLARQGSAPKMFIEHSLESLFVTNPQQTLDVYTGQIQHVELGLRALIETFAQRRAKSYPHAMRYVLGMMHLQKKLHKHPSMLSIIANRLDRAEQQRQHFDLTHENIIGNLATVYTDTISTFSYRIQVLGDFNYLQQPRIANQIRALLFSGIRATMLWRQVGGSRFHLIVNKRHIESATKRLYDQASNGTPR